MNTNPASLLSSEFLTDIKTQTATSHKKLESLPVSASILSPEMKIEDYIHYLSLMHDVHKNTEDTIYPLLSGIVEDLEQRQKTHLIEEDFLFLHHQKTGLAKVFDRTEMTVPFALGVLYVIEGSSLGGRFILKNIVLNPQLSNDLGVSYFKGYGDKTGSYWKNFLNVLAEYEQDYNCADDIIKGAIYAFDSIYNHFEKA
ncbi:MULTISPECIES: biliverdin-producing heme oxygenase [Flavobacterium]|uniref:biliverdin-producing heme oxygenase n=1 Tax=Flavobacterium TaxID=237 RepID=UPI0021146C54|nr:MULTISPECIES: biliverdin-producing heme oxygenase [Flavobacterium]UUF12857.1 biliverdin-producing heme oxygenase [Flavobacterium panici]